MHFNFTQLSIISLSKYTYYSFQYNIFVLALKKEGDNEYYENDKDQDKLDGDEKKKQKPRQYMFSDEQKSSSSPTTSAASAASSAATATGVASSSSKKSTEEIAASVFGFQGAGTVQSSSATTTDEVDSGEMEIDKVD